jgi:hypothetical protein
LSDLGFHTSRRSAQVRTAVQANQVTLRALESLPHSCRRGAFAWRRPTYPPAPSVPAFLAAAYEPLLRLKPPGPPAIPSGVKARKNGPVATSFLAVAVDVRGIARYGLRSNSSVHLIDTIF